MGDNDAGVQSSVRAVSSMAYSRSGPEHGGPKHGGEAKTQLKFWPIGVASSTPAARQYGGHGKQVPVCRRAKSLYARGCPAYGDHQHRAWEHTAARLATVV